MNASATDGPVPAATGPTPGSVVAVLWSGRTYASLVYLLLSFPLGLAYVGLLGLGALAGAALSIVGVGLLILLACLAAAWGFAIFGLAVCRALRRRSLVPIVMLTARHEEVDRVTGLEVGADDYVVKPFSLPELVARVRAMLRRVALDRAASAPEGGSGLLVSGPLVLDGAAFTASLAGEPVSLTRREFDLLALLVGHPGRTFTRDFLIDRAWGPDYDGLERAVDTQMVRLRRKLGDFGQRIEAVWGLGYRYRPAPDPSAPGAAGGTPARGS